MAPAKRKNRVFVIGVGMTKVNHFAFKRPEGTRATITKDFRTSIIANFRLRLIKKKKVSLNT